MNTDSRKGISAAVLKNVAVITMTIDHVTGHLLPYVLRGAGVEDVASDFWYSLGRIIGRIAFVLYAFMLAEGARKTHNKMNYALRLLLLAVISNVPYSYLHSQVFFNPRSLNVLFTLLTGLLMLYAGDWIKGRTSGRLLSCILRLLLTVAVCVVSEVLHMEYGLLGILLILVFYVFPDDFPRMALLVFVILTIGHTGRYLLHHGTISWILDHRDNLIGSLLYINEIQVFGVLALPFLYFYHGEKGRQLSKWFYYLFYPVHLAVIALISHIL